MRKVLYLFTQKGEHEQMITINDIAKTFLAIGNSMTHKKLQKLCYYAQAWHLAINGEPLVPNARFEAWVHGPVCPELYREYKWEGSDIIIKEGAIPECIESNAYVKSFIQSIYNMYGHLTGAQLESLTHTESPWLNARTRANVFYWQPSNEIILESDMKSYYKRDN